MLTRTAHPPRTINISAATLHLALAALNGAGWFILLSALNAPLAVDMLGLAAGILGALMAIGAARS